MRRDAIPGTATPSRPDTYDPAPAPRCALHQFAHARLSSWLLGPLCDQVDIFTGSDWAPSRERAATTKMSRPIGVAVMASSTKRLFIQLSVASASLYPMLAGALGLSDFQLESRLNEPLRARIEVVDVSDEEWRRIHTRLNWQASPEMAFVRPEVLDSVTLRATEDQSHRHYIEVRSRAVVTEPLFDLPIEVALSSSVRVIRNYSILLDPPAPGDDARQTLDASQAHGAQPALAGAQWTPSTAQPLHTRRVSRLHTRHRPTNVQQTNPTAADLTAPAGNRRTTGDTRAVTEIERKNLEHKLQTLQQTLAEMQATIATQNAQIIDLMVKVGTGSQSHARQAEPTSLQTSRPMARDASDAGAAQPEANPRSFFWITVGLGLTTMLALAAAIVAKRRASRSAQKLRRQPLRPIEQQTSTFKDEAARNTKPNSTRVPSGFTTPSMQQKQMEADGTVEIDWHKDEGANKPDWLRMLRGEHSLPPPQAIAPEPVASVAESPHETPLESEKLPAAYFDDVVKSYFAQLPSITAGELPEADTAILQGAGTAEPAEAETTRLRAADGTRLEEVDVAKILEEEVAKLTDADAAGLLNETTAKLPEPDMANVSEFPRSRRRR